MKFREALLIGILILAGARADGAGTAGRLTMFVGMDISGSFLNSRHYEDSLEFLSHYIYAHLQGVHGSERPNSLFVGSIGGNKANEPKTFYPIETFENENVGGIKKKLREIFPKTKSNAYTDFNAFFEQVATQVKNRKLILKPISIILVSDGQPDLPGEKSSDENYRKINLSPLEQLSRNVTLRLLYTNAIVGQKWQTKIPRKRVKIWTQDAAVMAGWNDPKIFLPAQPMEKQEKFLSWVKSNIDFDVRLQRVD